MCRNRCWLFVKLNCAVLCQGHRMTVPNAGWRLLVEGTLPQSRRASTETLEQMCICSSAARTSLEVSPQPSMFPSASVTLLLTCCYGCVIANISAGSAPFWLCIWWRGAWGACFLPAGSACDVHGQQVWRKHNALLSFAQRAVHALNHNLAF